MSRFKIRKNLSYNAQRKKCNRMMKDNKKLIENITAQMQAIELRSSMIRKMERRDARQEEVLNRRFSDCIMQTATMLNEEIAEHVKFRDKTPLRSPQWKEIDDHIKECRKNMAKLHDLICKMLQKSKVFAGLAEELKKPLEALQWGSLMQSMVVEDPVRNEAKHS